MIVSSSKFQNQILAAVRPHAYKLREIQPTLCNGLVTSNAVDGHVGSFPPSQAGVWR